MPKTVAQLMSVDFVTVTARMSLDDALNLLVESEATELCVVDDRGRFEGIVSDFDLLKAHLNGQLSDHCVGSLISRAVIVLSAEVTIEQAIPMFRDGSCSRAYVSRDGRLLGRLSRSNVLKHLTQKEPVVAPSMIRSALTNANTGKTSTIDSREPTPRTPQFMTSSATSVLSSLGVLHSRSFSPRPIGERGRG